MFEINVMLHFSRTALINIDITIVVSWEIFVIRITADVMVSDSYENKPCACHCTA